MKGAVVAFLCLLPLAAGFAGRFHRLRDRMDARARRAFVAKTAAFLGISFAGVWLLAAFRGAHPLPVFWLLLLTVIASSLLLGFLRPPSP